MDIKSSNGKFLLVLVGALLVLACATLTSSAPATQAPANTLAPTKVPLPTDTSLPPTATEIPVSPTPASIGEAVKSDSYEATVIQAKELRRVYMGDYYWYPNSGQMFVEVVVKVSNRTGFKVSIPWENVYVTIDTGDSYYPNWGGYKAVDSGKKVEGSSIGVDEIVDSKATLDFDEDAILRMIWFLPKKDKTTFVFGFYDTPQVGITIE